MERYDAYTMTFSRRDGAFFKVHINKDNAEDWPTMVNIKSYMTKRKLSLTHKNGFVKYTVWAKEIKRLRENKCYKFY